MVLLVNPELSGRGLGGHAIRRKVGKELAATLRSGAPTLKRP